jgi:sigma-B regulation protein RsbU (phosphoserine phosphatase)
MDGRLDSSRLESLLESARLLNASLRLEDLLGHLLRTVMGRMLAAKGAIAIARNGGFETAHARGLPSLGKGASLDRDSAAALGLDLVLTIGDASAPVGLLAVARRGGRALEEGEREFLDALLGLAASSIANAQAHEEAVQANRALDQKIQELRALVDLGRGLSATTEPDEIAQMLMLTLAGRWGVRKQALVTWKNGQPGFVRAKGLPAPNLELAMKAASVSGDSFIRAEELPVEVRMGLELPAGSVIFPIRSGEESTGMLVCGPRMAKTGYTDTDLEFGGGLVAQASVAFENAWHFAETLEKKKIEQELEVAAGIQRDLFPKQIPALHLTELAARNRQARQVGGDYYDVLAMGPAHLLVVADISGKGVSASLLMANIQATLRAVVTLDLPLPELAARTNDLLWASTPPNKYATAFFLRYDPATGDCVYVNAGHCDGIVLRANGDVQMLTTTGLPIGLFPKKPFEQASFSLAPGDTLLLYSDGVSEANDKDHNEFTVERVVAALRSATAQPCESILDCLIENIDAFAGGAPQFDDITAMVVKRLAP